MKDENNIGFIDTLDENVNSEISVNNTPIPPQNPVPNEVRDIPTAFFTPITQVEQQREEMLYDYNKEKGNIAETHTPDLTGEVNRLEKKLKSKKYSMPFLMVVILVVLINLAWFLGVRFLIVPKYEKYVSQSEEIKQNYDDLKRKVDALVGE